MKGSKLSETNAPFPKPGNLAAAITLYGAQHGIVKHAGRTRPCQAERGATTQLTNMDAVSTGEEGENSWF